MPAEPAVLHGPQLLRGMVEFRGSLPDRLLVMTYHGHPLTYAQLHVRPSSDGELIIALADQEPLPRLWPYPEGQALVWVSTGTIRYRRADGRLENLP